MNLVCPSCGKGGDYSLALTTDASIPETYCGRCQSDLTQLLNVYRSAAFSQGHALSCLRTQEWMDALDWAESAWHFDHSAKAARLGILASLGAKDLDLLARWRQRSTFV